MTKLILDPIKPAKRGLTGWVSKEFSEDSGIYFWTDEGRVVSLWGDGSVVESVGAAYNEKIHQRVLITSITMETID